MMIPMIEFFAALLGCLALSSLLHSRIKSRQRADAAADIDLIEHTLTLLQLLQKHRGLGAQQSKAAAFQREQIAREIGNRWHDWDSSMSELNYLHAQWQKLKQQPDDFDHHCTVIKHLLGFIEILANRGDTHYRAELLSIAEHCRALEDLARLRGLSSKAAQFAQCPIELKVPLKYLCQNLQSADLQRHRDRLQAALIELNEQLLEAERTRISAVRCFDLLTPIIDGALDDIRSSLQQLRDKRMHRNNRDSLHVQQRHMRRSDHLANASAL